MQSEVIRANDAEDSLCYLGVGQRQPAERQPGDGQAAGEYPGPDGRQLADDGNCKQTIEVAMALRVAYSCTHLVAGEVEGCQP